MVDCKGPFDPDTTYHTILRPDGCGVSPAASACYQRVAALSVRASWLRDARGMSDCRLADISKAESRAACRVPDCCPVRCVTVESVVRTPRARDSYHQTEPLL